MVNDMASIATGYDAKTGEVLWQGRMGEAARESFSASPVVVDGKVYFTSDQGKWYFRTDRTDRELIASVPDRNRGAA